MGWAQLGQLGGGAGGGMMVPKQQIFTASGTFTPPPGMIAQGGHCEVLLVGGGMGGTRYNNDTYLAGGPGGAVLHRHLSGVVTPQQVIVGAGGGVTYSSGNFSPQRGGDSRFGELLRAYGGTNDPRGKFDAIGAIYAYGGHAANGVTTKEPHPPILEHYGGGGNARFDTMSTFPPKNTGQGGHAGVEGASGICIVTWWEAAE